MSPRAPAVGIEMRAPSTALFVRSAQGQAANRLNETQSETLSERGTHTRTHADGKEHRKELSYHTRLSSISLRLVLPSALARLFAVVSALPG